MSNELVVNERVLDEYLLGIDKKLTPSQKTMFYQLAMQFNLNPFKREIYMIPYGSGWNYVTGYQVYIKRADSTGLLNGWEIVPIKEGDKLLGARVTIYRKDWAYPFIWEVSLSEFKKDTATWKTMPEFMIKKVCIAQGFRMCFTKEFSGMPYIAEEIDNIQEDVNNADVLTDFEMRLQNCFTLEELKKEWVSLTKTHQFLQLTKEGKQKLIDIKNNKQEYIEKNKEV